MCRTVSLPLDRKVKNLNRVIEALALSTWGSSVGFINMGQFQKIEGQLQHAVIAMPCTGFTTPLNRVLATATTTVGLGAKSELCETLEAFLPMLDWAHN